MILDTDMLASIQVESVIQSNAKPVVQQEWKIASDEQAPIDMFMGIQSSLEHDHIKNSSFDSFMETHSDNQKQSMMLSDLEQQDLLIRVKQNDKADSYSIIYRYLVEIGKINSGKDNNFKQRNSEAVLSCMQANPAIMLAIVNVDDESSTDNLFNPREQPGHLKKKSCHMKKPTTARQSPAHLFEDDSSCRSSQQGGIAFKNLITEAYEDATVVL